MRRMRCANMSSSINENYISIEDAALFLNIKPVTLRKWIKDNMLIGLTQQGTRFRCLSQLILAVPAIESGVKLIHTNHIL